MSVLFQINWYVLREFITTITMRTVKKWLNFSQKNAYSWDRYYYCSQLPNKKVRHRMGKWLAQDYTASRWLCWDPSPSSLSQSMHFPTVFPRLSSETPKDETWIETVYEVIVMDKLLWLWEEELVYHFSSFLQKQFLQQLELYHE